MTDHRYTCPLCSWFHDEPELTELQSDPMALASVFGVNVMATLAANQRAERIERKLQEHFGAHKTVEWLRRVEYLRHRLTRAQRWLMHDATCPSRLHGPVPSDGPGATACNCGLYAFIEAGPNL